MARPRRGRRGSRSAILFCALFAGFGCRAVAAEVSPQDLEFFEAKIRPILVESCYKCHSDEAGKSKADLLLDSRDALRKGGASGAAIVPGDPEKSLLIEAIRYQNEDLQMPPPDDGGKLSAGQIALLTEWVKRGAPDPRTGGKAHPMNMAVAGKHWAFQPVLKPVVPPVRTPAWVATPVDAFVLAKLEEKNLAPSAPADPRTLLRRVTYDLTGLPPTPEEMDAFLGDKTPGAYARVVERLLASPRYGERWGRYWLDVARYADTKGYLAGNVERRYTFSHTYRDYVIRAFNADTPYDQFVVEQIAADKLALPEDKSPLAAMGFMTLGRRFLNNQNDIIDDRIDVVTRGLMGLTVTCARCHDHKFDPIPTKDYYSLHGVFASSEEPEEKPLLGPLIESPAYEQFLHKTAEIERKIKALERSEVDKFFAGVRAKTGDYLLGAHDAKKRPASEKIDVFAGARKLNPEVLKRYQPWLDARAQEHDPVLGPWFALAALPEAEFSTKAAELIRRWTEFATPNREVTAARLIENEHPGRAPFNPLVVEAFVKAEKPVASLQAAAAIYNEIFAATDKAWQKWIEAHSSRSESSDSQAKPDSDALAELPGRPTDVSLVGPTALPDADREAIRQRLYATDAPSNLGYDETLTMLKRQIDGKRAPLRREIEALNWTEPGAPLRAMALVDKAKPVNTRVFLRGNPANRGPEAPRQFLEILGGPDRGPFRNGSGRLELAQAIVDPKNPLTARVLVNRVWGWHFGQALVRTPSDFGVRTAAPVQRELLDWLAASFIENGWSVKQLHRWIVLSRTYRQSSDENPEAAPIDPDNERVHRFNRRRLDFEAMRDTLLAVSGTLDLKSGGLPDDLTSQPFTTRRTVYGFIDRQNLPGMFRTFDYPNPDVSSAQRFATTVPQQALFMMNSPFVLEQARQSVRRAGASAEADAATVRALYRVVYQRSPDNEELRLARDFLQRPVEPAEPPAAFGGWAFGYGAFNAESSRIIDFQRMTSRQNARASPSETFPDPRFGHLSVTAAGGHPGVTADLASIRRWTAPAQGAVRIEGALSHPTSAGDGVRGRVVSSVRGKLGEWTVHNRKADTAFATMPVEAGETIDFVVDARSNDTSDSFTWAPNITFTGKNKADALSRTWNAKKDFDRAGHPVAPLNRWEEFAQVLLLSNELAFVD